MAKIAAIAFSVILLLSIQAPVFALTEGPAQIIIQTPVGEQGNTQILPQIQGYTLQFIYRDKTFEQRAKQDASLLYAYIPIDKTKVPIYVAVEIAATRSSLHRWEACLITYPLTHGYQPKVTQLELKDIQILQNPPITARYFAFQYTKTNQTQLVLYWYETSTFKANQTAQQKHVKISLIAYPKTPEETQTIENQLIQVAKAMANYWQPIKTWTQIALTISQNGPASTAATATLLATMLILYTFNNRREKRRNYEVYQKLSKTTKQIIDALSQTEKCITPTLENITKTHQSMISEKISEKDVLQALLKAEKIGLVSHQIANRQDEPTQIWKINLKQP